MIYYLDENEDTNVSKSPTKPVKVLRQDSTSSSFSHSTNATTKKHPMTNAKSIINNQQKPIRPRSAFLERTKLNKNNCQKPKRPSSAFVKTEKRELSTERLFHDQLLPNRSQSSLSLSPSNNYARYTFATKSRRSHLEQLKDSLLYGDEGKLAHYLNRSYCSNSKKYSTSNNGGQETFSFADKPVYKNMPTSMLKWHLERSKRMETLQTLKRPSFVCEVSETQFEDGENIAPKIKVYPLKKGNTSEQIHSEPKQLEQPILSIGKCTLIKQVDPPKVPPLYRTRPRSSNTKKIISTSKIDMTDSLVDSILGLSISKVKLNETAPIKPGVVISKYKKKTTSFPYRSDPSLPDIEVIMKPSDVVIEHSNE
ncbi:hypothetical protein BC833DRAFT_601617 [Globomyces pollinis-pini]|nr:hypothetical protein BC833DRAFT_601617 [Globomyces pollinis-pini]